MSSGDITIGQRDPILGKLLGKIGTTFGGLMVWEHFRYDGSGPFLILSPGSQTAPQLTPEECLELAELLIRFSRQELNND